MSAARSKARYAARGIPVVLVLAVSGLALTGQLSRGWRPDIPRVWDEASLADWATPLAGLNARPTHMTAAEYYALPEENLRSYPVYMPAREPPGYWERDSRLWTTAADRAQRARDGTRLDHGRRARVLRFGGAANA